MNLDPIVACEIMTGLHIWKTTQFILACACIHLTGRWLMSVKTVCYSCPNVVH